MSCTNCSTSRRSWRRRFASSWGGSVTDRIPFRKVVSFALGGGWGQASRTADSVRVAVIRGTDFARVAAGHVDGVPRRWENEKRASRRLLAPGDLLLEISGGSS